MQAKQLQQARRLVVKVGSALLVDQSTGQVRIHWLRHFLSDIARCHQREQEVILVSSGAIAIGRDVIKSRGQLLRLPESQAAAAIGQIRLAHAYQTELAHHDINVAQILLTIDDSENRRRYLNARNTLENLLKHRIIPIINENDTVATAEIRYGDNDRLAARVAQMMDADCLVLLSDIDGLYTANPHKDASAEWVPEVTHVSPAIYAMGDDPHSRVGTGGMRTKLKAAEIAMSSGCHMVIAQGDVNHPINAIEQGARCTWFTPQLTPQRARKNWLKQHLQIKGEMIVDNGAAAALKSGKSLLAVGIIQITGHFQKGDAVTIKTPDGQIIARGLSQYPAHHAEKIIGKPSQQIHDILGYFAGDEVIHRNDLVLLD